MKLSTLPEHLRRLRHDLQTRVGAWLEDPERERSVFLVLTLLIGAVVGATTVAFILVTERLGARLFPLDSSSWRRLAVPTLTAGLAGFLLHRYFPEARGSGIPQTRAALLRDRGRISLRTVLGKFACTSATIAGGVPLGREGPSVHVGAGVASVFGQSLRLSTKKVKQLVPVGAAAAIAAAFNTPVAAVLFTLEELMGDLHAPVIGNVVLGAATSWLVLRLMLGNEPLFHVPHYELVHPGELVIYAVLGLIGGLVSVGFVRMLLSLRLRFKALPAHTRPFQPIAGGLLVGALALFIPEVLGSGYRFIGDSLVGRMAITVMAPLLLLKLLTVAVAYASGNAGGIFGPSLFMGAMTGGCLGTLAHWLLPNHTAAPGAYALVGMGALFAGIVRAPFTSVVMIFELTHDYAIIVPLMVSNLVSLFVSRRLQRETVYVALSKQDGFALPEHESRRERTLRQIMRIATKEEADVLALLDDDRQGPRLDPDDSLERALEKLGAAGTSLAPVHDDDRPGPSRYVVTLSDILDAYGVGQKHGAGHHGVPSAPLSEGSRQSVRFELGPRDERGAPAAAQASPGADEGGGVWEVEDLAPDGVRAEREAPASAADEASRPGQPSGPPPWIPRG